MTNESTNTAIVRKEHRHIITFADMPQPETCKQLRKYGYDFDRRSGYWFKSEVIGSATTEEVVVNSVAA